MKWKIVAPALLWAALTVVPAASAAGTNWGLGTSLGLQVFMPSGNGSENLTSLGWPWSSNAFTPWGGGLRLSFTGESATHEGYLETGVSHIGVEHYSLTSLFATADYQYNFPTEGPIKPYVALGGGLDRLSESDGSSVGATGFLFGGGLGVQHRLGNGHGRLRGEVRFDHQSEAEDDRDVIIPSGNILGVKLGFDLWMK